MSSLCDAAKSSNKDEVQRLLASNVDVNQVDNDGDTALRCAVHCGAEAVVTELLSFKADVNKENNFGNTPLHAAIFNGNTLLVEQLVFAKADVNHANKYGITSVHAAAFTGFEDALQMLIDANADLNRLDSDGLSPFHTAVFRDYDSIARLMFSGGANASVKTGEGKTAVQLALDNGNNSLAKLLEHTPGGAKTVQAHDTLPLGHRLLDVSNEPFSVISPVRGVLCLTDANIELAVKGIPVADVEADAALALFFAETTPSLPANVSHHQLAAIRMHTFDRFPFRTSFHFVLNQSLRSTDRSQVIPFYPYLKLLLGGLNALPSFQGTVYCGMPNPLPPSCTEGRKVLWWGCVCCTQDPTAVGVLLESSQVKTTFVVEVENGVDIHQFCDGINNREVLLPPGSWFQTIKIVHSEDSRCQETTVHLKECKGVPVIS